MRKFRLLGIVVVLAAPAAAGVTSAPASADGFVCPDKYEPAPAIVAPGQDTNENGIICVKTTQASNGHVNTKDDKQYVDDVV